MGLALGTNLKFYASLSKGLKLKVRKFWGLIPTFIEVTGEELVGEGGYFCPPPSWIGLTKHISYECKCKSIDDPLTCDEILKEKKTVRTNFNETDIICETKIFYNLLAFLLITVALLIDDRFYWHLIRYRGKKIITILHHKQELKEVIYW